MTAAPAGIPALPVTFTLAIVAFAVVACRLACRRAVTAPQIAVAVVACAYGAALLNSVLLPFPIQIGAARDDLVSWRLFVQVIPMITARADPIGIVLNVVLFVPLGLILPLFLRISSARRVAMTGFFLSLGIELAQFVADVTVSTGRVADVDDLLGNTLGALVGYAAFRIMVQLPTAARFAAAATWFPAAQDGVRTSGLVSDGCWRVDRER